MFLRREFDIHTISHDYALVFFKDRNNLEEVKLSRV